MLFSLLALHLHAAAAEPVASAPVGVDAGQTWTSPPVEHVAIGSTGSSGSSKSSSKSSKSSKSSSKDSTGTEKIFKSFKIGGWKVRPYVEPGGGVQLNASNASGVAGLDAGFKYTRKKWAGNLYAGGSATIGDGTTGWEAHLGDDTGARFKYWGVTLGLEGGYSGYVFATGDSVKAAPTASIPLKVVVGPKKYHIGVGIMPTFTGDPGRRVNWAKTDAVGFGDEFTWDVVGVINYKQVAIKATFTQQVLAGTNGQAIVTNTPTISVGMGDVISISQ